MSSTGKYCSCSLILSPPLYWHFSRALVTRVSNNFAESTNLRRNIIRYFIAFNATIILIFFAFVIAFAVVRNIPRVMCGGVYTDIDQTSTLVLQLVLDFSSSFVDWPPPCRPSLLSIACTLLSSACLLRLASS